MRSYVRAGREVRTLSRPLTAARAHHRDSHAAHQPKLNGKPFLYSGKDKAFSDKCAKHITKPDQLRGALKGGQPNQDFRPPGVAKRVGGQDVWPSFRVPS
jgi:hypothetical protein